MNTVKYTQFQTFNASLYTFVTIG